MPPALASAPADDKTASSQTEGVSSGNPFYVTGGTLPPSAPSYITRQADTDLYEALRAGQFCYVLNTRQIGKSSLMIRTVRRLKESGAAVVVLDLTAIGQNLSVEQWYDGLLVMLSEQLHLEDECEDFWMEADNLGPMQRFFAALGQAVLPNIGADRHLILFVDEIDSVRSLPFSADEFFAGIRECYNRRVQNPEYERVTFCLLGVATPADLIQDSRLSPFNIGRRVTLRDFAPEEAAPLAQGMGPNGKALLDRALYWTGGHPYLTQRLCRQLSLANSQTVADVDKLCEDLFLLKRALDTDDNLSFVQNRVLRSEFPLADVLDFYGKLRDGRKIKDDETNALCGLLRLAGIASVDERTDTLRLRNRIYSTVFNKAWVLKNMPDAELRRQRQAAWAGRLQAGSISAVVFIVMAILLIRINEVADEAHRSEKTAQEQRIQADEQRRKAEKSEHLAIVAQDLAKREATRAEQSYNSARRSEQFARKNEAKAIAAKIEADKQRHIAVGQRQRADQEASKARQAAIKAQQSEELAVAARDDAKRQTQIALNEGKRAREEKKRAEQAADSERKANLKTKETLQQMVWLNSRRIARLQKIVEERKTDTDAAVELGRIFLDDKKYDQAIEYYNIVLSRDPRLYSNYLDRGFCYSNLKPPQYAQAVQDFTHYINGTPNTEANATNLGSAYQSRANAYFSLGNYNATLQDLRIQEKIGAPPIDYKLRGDSLMALKQYGQAAEAFEQFAQHSKSISAINDNFFYLAEARRLQGEYDAAAAAYGRYREVHPNVEPVYEQRVVCLLLTNRWEEVLRECNLYRRAFPNSAKIYPWRAYSYLNTNDLKSYRTLCNEGMVRFGNADAKNANLAAWTCALGPNGLPDYSQALQIAQRAVSEAARQIKPGAVDSESLLGDLWANRNTLAALLYRAGRYADAIRELEKCEAMQRTFHPDDHFGDYILLALANARSGKRQTAEDWLKKAQATISSPPGVEQQIFLKEADTLLNKSAIAVTKK